MQPVIVTSVIYFGVIRVMLCISLFVIMTSVIYIGIGSIMVDMTTSE